MDGPSVGSGKTHEARGDTRPRWMTATPSGGQNPAYNPLPFLHFNNPGKGLPGYDIPGKGLPGYDIHGYDIVA